MRSLGRTLLVALCSLVCWNATAAEPSISVHYSIRLPISDVAALQEKQLTETFSYVLAHKTGLGKTAANTCVTFSLGVYGDEGRINGFNKRLPPLVLNPAASNPDDPESPPAGCTKKTCTKSCTEESDKKKVCTTECEYTCDSKKTGEKIAKAHTGGVVPVKPGQGGCYPPIGLPVIK